MARWVWTADSLDYNTATMKHLALAILVAGLSSAGCGQKSPAVGTERGACYGNGTCNAGLMCMSDLCVSPPPADCNKVATKLNFLVLGNYATQQERDEYIANMITTCRQAKLSLADADCILESKNRTALSRCPRPLALGSCQRVLTKVAELVAGTSPDISNMLDNGPALRACQQKGITKQQEECVMRATNKQQLEACGRF